MVLTCQSLLAATLCVNSGGTGSCKSSISAAVAAASAGDTIEVAAGVYAEGVIIRKSLSLIGAGRGLTTIDATGQSNGIFIDGTAASPSAGVSSVVVNGFTIENANFEGILAASATDVTLLRNEVIDNNRSLTSSACPGVPAFETNEAMDCGEGIHLMGTDHSIVADNLVHNNSGGILVTDETGPNHDNLITGNTVSFNAFACGITLASHPAAALANPTTPFNFGVYHNTVSNNQSFSNGLAVGGGAGVGLFAPGPGSKTYGNLVIGNTLSSNGLPGVAMHNHAAPPHAPAVTFNDNSIIGNTIRFNGPDSADAATRGPTGINIYSVTPMTGTVVAQNLIDHEGIDVAVNVASTGTNDGPQIQVHLNSFLPNGLQPNTEGISNTGMALVDATENWWGCVVGPGTWHCTEASANVTFSPWLVVPTATTTTP